MSDFLLVLSTLPDQASAEHMAEMILGERLAACVNISSPTTSLYIWNEEIERNTEVTLLIKTHASRYAALESALQANHPYELPEVIAVPITQGLTDYLAWMEKCTQDC
jgi:periplasmic divalent cation tolerance protein